MNIDQFWAIVEEVHASAPSDMERKCRTLEEKLRALSIDDLRSFGRHFRDLFFRAYTWDLWGAAFVICDGCSDDSFMDFRSTLISLGRVPFHAALTDADSLADFTIDPAWACYEGYQYVPGRVHEERCSVPPRDDQTGPVHPSEPTGVRFNEWEMSARFPRLVAKYGYNDSDWISEKIRKEKAARDWEEGRRLANLMVESGIISSNGLIPPVRIVRSVLRTGKSPDPKRGTTWEPFELDESHFWQAVTQLENEGSDKGSTPGWNRPSFKLDVHASDEKNYSEWLESLKNRGVA